MKKILFKLQTPVLLLLLLLSCNENNTESSKELIAEIHLKRGDVISCGSPDQQFGSVDFEMTCDEKEQMTLTSGLNYYILLSTINLKKFLQK